eukprot:3940076-Amphidinium_carterae.1
MVCVRGTQGCSCLHLELKYEACAQVYERGVLPKMRSPSNHQSKLTAVASTVHSSCALPACRRRVVSQICAKPNP